MCAEHFAAFGGLVDTQSPGIHHGPENVAVLTAETTTLTCSTNDNANIRWYEYVTNPSGVLISDGKTLQPSHPNFDRYELVHTDLKTFSLKIRNINVNDAGYYQCQDSKAVSSSTVRRGAQLVVIGTLTDCLKVVSEHRKQPILK